MKKIVSLLLSLTLLASLAVQSVSAAESIAVAPDWMPADEYTTFEGSAAYEPEVWSIITGLRGLAASGATRAKCETLLTRLSAYALSGDAGVLFELGLIKAKLYGNLASLADGSDNGRVELAQLAAYVEATAPTSQQAFVTHLWYARTLLTPPYDETAYEEAIAKYIAFTGADMSKLLAADVLAALPQETRTRELSALRVLLDGGLVHPKRHYLSDAGWADTKAAVRNDRTMVPVRALAELIGATVGYDGATRSVTMTRAGVTIVMTLDSTTAYRNGEAFEMDVAPCVIDERTYIPARYMAEFFGQTVEWDAAARVVRITENKSVVGDSNLEAWALPMGAVQPYLKLGEDPSRFGSSPRSKYDEFQDGLTACNSNRQPLRDSWGITDRKTLIESVCYMTEHGHNEDFIAEAEKLAAMSPSAYRSHLATLSASEQAMCRYTKELYEKWGARGILCWDYFRMSSVVQWGYMSGYVSYAEALALLEPAARGVQSSFTSWQEAYENYVDGYNWWSKNDGAGKATVDMPRGDIYGALLENPAWAGILNDDLFTQPIVGVPSLTAEQLLASVS